MNDSHIASTKRKCDWCTVAEQHCQGRLEYCNCECVKDLQSNEKCKYCGNMDNHEKDCPVNFPNVESQIVDTICKDCQQKNKLIKTYLRKINELEEEVQDFEWEGLGDDL